MLRSGLQGPRLGGLADEAQSAAARERHAAHASDGHWRRRRVTFGVGYSGAPRRQYASIAGDASVRLAEQGSRRLCLVGPLPADSDSPA